MDRAIPNAAASVKPLDMFKLLADEKIVKVPKIFLL